MEHDLHLVGAAVTLIPLQSQHAAQLAALSDTESLAFHTSPQPLTESSAGSDIESMLANPTVLPLAVTDTCDGTVADTAYFAIVRAEWPDVRRGLLGRVSGRRA